MPRHAFALRAVALGAQLLVQQLAALRGVGRKQVTGPNRPNRDKQRAEPNKHTKRTGSPIEANANHEYLRNGQEMLPFMMARMH
jgi:hypothetical protein